MSYVLTTNLKSPCAFHSIRSDGQRKTRRLMPYRFQHVDAICIHRDISCRRSWCDGAHGRRDVFSRKAPWTGQLSPIPFGYRNTRFALTTRPFFGGSSRLKQLLPAGRTYINVHISSTSFRDSAERLGRVLAVVIACCYQIPPRQHPMSQRLVHLTARLRV